MTIPFRSLGGNAGGGTLARFAARFARDPRHYQMSVQAALLLCGLTLLDFEIGPWRMLWTLAATLGAQWAFTKLANFARDRHRREGPKPAAAGSAGGAGAGVARETTRPATAPPGFEWRSAMISGLSLCLLLRTSSAWLVLAAALLTIGSKFLLRWRGKHLFNPTCFGLVALIALTPHAWVSPGQWGHAAVLGFAIGCLGSVVVTRAARADVTFAFLAAWAAILFGRAAWLGQPWGTPLHMLANGSILLFAFFMISDPRTTPASRAGRLVFAVLVATGAAFVQFVLFRTNGPLWSLAACAVLVPLLDHWLPGARHHWTTDAATNQSTKGTRHATSLVASHA